MSSSYDKLLSQLEEASQSALAGLQDANDTQALEGWYRENLGRKGAIQGLSRGIGQIEADERPLFGKRINEVKTQLQTAYEAREATLKRAELEAEIAGSGLDVTLPGRKRPLGSLHPTTQILRRMYRIFGDMGFQVYRSPDVETDAYNFELLNFPPHHPAREMQDSFYTEDPDVILRTHTSAGQIRAMRQFHPEPIRVILPGMCYRNEQVTMRSEFQFYQIEGLVVGQNITFADLKGTLSEFARRLFGRTETRFRASYFPFTEPSAEMDVYWGLETERDRRMTKGTGWLEILGCGMVHPNVLRNGGYDPNEYSGFAFGMGIERIAMNRYNIDDIRQFHGNDLRFLQQF